MRTFGTLIPGDGWKQRLKRLASWRLKGGGMGSARAAFVGQLSRAAPWLLLAAGFALSRWIFWSLGVRCSRDIGWWQCLDSHVLRERLCPALFNLHSQPPGFNLLLGMALKTCPDSYLTCPRYLYLLLGFALYCSLYCFLRLSKWSRPLAILCASLFIVSPNACLYENWVFYTYPVAVFLALASVALRRFQDARSTASAAAFLLLCAMVCLTRSTFHLVFLVGCVPFVLIPQGVRRRRVMSWAVVAVALVAAWYLKNLAQFGFFGATSWSGMNLFRIASYSAGTNTVAGLVRPGSIRTTGSGRRPTR